MLNWYYMNRQRFIYKVKTPRNIMTTQNVHMYFYRTKKKTTKKPNYKYFKSNLIMTIIYSC